MSGKSRGGESWPAAVCTRLELIQQQRDVLKAEESDLSKERKTLVEELIDLGAGETKEHLAKSREYVVCVFRLKYVRTRLDTLADMADKTIRKAHQPELFDEDNADVVGSKRVTERGVFAALRKADQDKGQKRLHEDEDEPAEERKPGRGIVPDAFPGLWRLTPTPRHPGGPKTKEALVECAQIGNLREVVAKHLGAAPDKIDAATGDVSLNGECVLRISFVKPLAA